MLAASWNPAYAVQEMWSYPFMVNAFRAGTITAVLAGAVGWFMVLRRQSFVGHTLATIAFPGGAGATLLGLSAPWGYYAFCLAGALLIALLPATGNPIGTSLTDESATIGTVLAFGLACGYLFVSLYHGLLGGMTGLLFGSILGITTNQVWTLAGVAAALLLGLALTGRRLLFASIVPDVAASRAVPTRGLSVLFVVLLGLAAAAASQITGTLLVFALLVMPAATAQTLSPQPRISLPLTVLLGTVETWLGLTLAFYTPYPLGFCVTTLAFAAYLAAHGLQHWSRLRTRTRKPRARAKAPS